MEDQRRSRARLQAGHLAGDDHVVAAGDHVAQLAGDPDEGAFDRGDAVALAPLDAGPLVGDRGLGGEGAGDLLLPRVEDVDAEAVGRLHGQQRA